MAKKKINPAVLAYHKANRYYDIFSKEELLGKQAHVKNVIALSKTIANSLGIDVNMTFLKICAEHHDDGRVNQYEILGKFWDTKTSHNVLGIDRLDKFLATRKDLKIDHFVSILRDVILWHGRMRLTNLPAESKPYVDIITAADDFENACSCVSYLVKEVETDAKGYIEKNPQADQKEVSDFVWDHFEKGEKFDKNVYCTTYAEYVLFATTLATNCIKRYGNVAKDALSQPGYGYDSIIEGYRYVFSKTLTPDMAKRAIAVIEEMIA